MVVIKNEDIIKYIKIGILNANLKIVNKQGK